MTSPKIRNILSTIKRYKERIRELEKELTLCPHPPEKIIFHFRQIAEDDPWHQCTLCGACVNPLRMSPKTAVIKSWNESGKAYEADDEIPYSGLIEVLDGRSTWKGVLKPGQRVLVERRLKKSPEGAHLWWEWFIVKTLPKKRSKRNLPFTYKQCRDKGIQV